MTGSIRRRSRSHAAPSLLVRIRGSGPRPPSHWHWPPGSSGRTFSGGGSYPPCRWGVEHHRGGMRARGTERALAFTDSDSVRTATALGESEPTRRARHEAQRLSRKLRAWPGLGPRAAAAMPGRHRRAFFSRGQPGFLLSGPAKDALSANCQTPASPLETAGPASRGLFCVAARAPGGTAQRPGILGRPALRP
jgi:hypothetical protein